MPKSKYKQKQDRKAKELPPVRASIYIFVDNSNIWIEGKKVSGRNLKRPIPSNYRYRIDYGRLLDLVQGPHSLGDVPRLYGSEPPPADTVWKKIKQHGFDVTVFKRNIFNREKGLDVMMGVDMAMLATRVKPPAVIGLVAGDADYAPVVEKVIEMGWQVDVWYWRSAAGVLKKAATFFHTLDPYLNQIGFQD
jgi:uncharacterized LabA/DUF88 family protein